MLKMRNLEKKIKEIAPLVTKLKEEKSKNSQKAAKKFKNDDSYKFNHLLIERHIFFKAFKEVN